MLRHLFASVLVMGSAVALSAPSANAQSVNLPFSGTMTTNCTFGIPTPGILVPIGMTTLTEIGGGRGSVSLNCSAPANITTSAPIQTSGTPLSLTSCYVFLGTNFPFQGCAGTSPPISFSGSETLSVGMTVTDSKGIPPGAYSYNVTLTITP